jgi:hypothetical protein
MLKGVLMASAFGIGTLVLMVPTGPVRAAPPVSLIEVPNAKVEVGRRHHRGWHRHRRHRHGFSFYVAPRYHYRGGCAWLRHRAQVTGSRYWWRRYRRCRGW